MVASFFLLLTVASWAYWLLAWYLVRRFFSGREPEAGYAPPLSVLKPVRGLDPDAYENFASFCRQDYPEFEVVFGVMNPDDPALEAIERLRRDFPERRIRVEVAPPLGANRKVSVLHHLAQRASYPLLLVSDSDVRVSPDLFRRVVAPLADPGVGLVTCPYRGEGPRSLAAVLEALYMGLVFLPATLAGRTVVRMRFALGACLALRKSDLSRIGGYAAIADHLADDYQLGYRIAELGLEVRLSQAVVSCVLGRAGLRETWLRQVRWARCTRASRPGGYAGLFLTMATPLAVAFVVASGADFFSLRVLGATLLLRWWIGASVASIIGDPNWRWQLLLPLTDLVDGAVWLAAAFGRRVYWRGDQFELQSDGTLLPAAGRRLHAQRLKPRQPVEARDA